MTQENNNLLFGSAFSYSTGRGDWIPDMYKKVFKTKDGGADLPVCHVLSKIVFWHTPSKSGKKRYRGKYPYLSTSVLAGQLHLSRKQVRRSLDVLEKSYQLIERKRHGRKVYIALNTSNIAKLFLPLMEEQGSESLIISYAKKDVCEEMVPSGANEKEPQMPSGARENEISSPQGQTYNIKKKHNSKTEWEALNNSNKIIYSDKVEPDKRNVMEAVFDQDLLDIKRSSMSEKVYMASCNVALNFVRTQLSNGKSMDDLMDQFLLNPLLDNVAYPAFARLHCLVNEELIHECDKKKLRKFLYVLKGECGGNPDLANRLEEHCPDVDYESVDLDLEEHKRQARLKLAEVFDKALINNKKMETLKNEDS